ncbi:MAG: hypothetical protein VX904_09395 [Planctomycetota bacterium]|nr:hypothetical protein [Planctomycetota bacterium]
MESREFIASGFARVRVFAELEVPSAQAGGLYRWFTLVGSLFGRSGRSIRGTTLLRLGGLWLLALLKAIFPISRESTVDCVDVFLAVRVDEVVDVTYSVDVGAWRSMYGFAVAVEVLIGDLNGFWAACVLYFVVDGSPDFGWKFP